MRQLADVFDSHVLLKKCDGTLLFPSHFFLFTTVGRVFACSELPLSLLSILLRHSHHGVLLVHLHTNVSCRCDEGGLCQ